MNAGWSATRMGFKLWGRHLLRWSRIAGGAAVGTFGAGWWMVGTPGRAAVGGVAVGAVVLAFTGARCPQDARRWFQGANGERRTARRLRNAGAFGGLRGWWFAHDLRIPRSRANLDHVAVHPSGQLVVYLDTKAWHARNATVRVHGNRLMYGPWDQTKTLDTIAWECDQLRTSLDRAGFTGEVVSILVCDGADVEGGVLTLDNDMWVVASVELPRMLRELMPSARRNRSNAQHTWQLVLAGFPRK